VEVTSIRLGIGSAITRRSGIWRIWVNKKGDVYVSVRCLGGVWKISLHKDGNCQFGFTKEYSTTASTRFGIESRHAEVWRLPTAPFIRALQILIPESELRIQEVVDIRKINWLPDLQQRSIGTITIFIVQSGVKIELDEGLKAVQIWELCTNTRKALITYAVTPYDAELEHLVSREKEKMHSVARSLEIQTGTRAIIADTGKHFERTILELAL
jgi:hypothetical protein